MTYHFVSTLAQRPDVEFQLLLPRDAPIDGVGFAERVSKVLPTWRASFGRAVHTIPSFLRPRSLAGVDLVHSLVEFPYGILAARLAARSEIPYLISGQGTYCVAPLQRWPDRLLYRWALRGAAVVTVPSPYTKEAMKSASNVALEIRVLHNAVDPLRFDRSVDDAAVRKRINLPIEARLILSVGAIKQRKGFDTLIQAFGKVTVDEPDVHLVIVGEGSASGLQVLARQLGLESTVHCLGTVPEDDLVDLYHACDLFVLLPRNERWHFEGFGLVFLEAGASGKPVVATQSGGVPAAVRHGQTGLLVPEDDADGAAAAILRLLRNPSLARRLGEGGLRWARAHAWPRYVDQMVEIYREVLERSLRTK